MDVCQRGMEVVSHKIKQAKKSRALHHAVFIDTLSLTAQCAIRALLHIKDLTWSYIKEAIGHGDALQCRAKGPFIFSPNSLVVNPASKLTEMVKVKPLTV